MTVINKPNTFSRGAFMSGVVLRLSFCCTCSKDMDKGSIKWFELCSTCAPNALQGSRHLSLCVGMALITRLHKNNDRTADVPDW